MYCAHCEAGPFCVACGRDDGDDGRDERPAGFIRAVRVTRTPGAVGVPAAEGLKVAREVSRWRALCRAYFAARRQGLDAPAALVVVRAVLGITPDRRPVVPAGWDHL
jgi:hypothetical protein